MKIVYITDALAIWGGLERVLIEKVNELAVRYGYEVYLLTTNQGNHPVPFSLHPNIIHRDLDILLYKQYDYSGLYRLIKKVELKRLFAKRLREQIIKIQPDIMVCVRSELLDVANNIKGKIPVIYESHTLRYAQHFIGAHFYAQLKEKWYNLSVRHVKMVIALTEGDAKDWMSLNRHVNVIPNVVHLNIGDHYCNYQSKSVIYVGRYDKQKDIFSLLLIWKIIHEKYPDWQLHIYGGYGDEQEKLMAEINQMDADIYAHEPTSVIFDKYLDSSILLFTSLYEPFGLVIPEAMSCGLPVVAFDCPYGPSDIITDGVDGFLIKNRSINEFAEKVCLLMEDIELRKRMGKAGILSSQRYSADIIMPLWRSLFEQLVQ